MKAVAAVHAAVILWNEDAALERGRSMTRQERADRVTRRLREVYPDAHCELNHGSPLELLVATILSAQCTDKRVNMVTPALFARYRTAADYAKADPADLEELVRTTGFFRSKAKNIRAAAREIVEQHGGEVPDSMEALQSLPGVGRKTANVVLGNAFGKNVGVVVDTHVARLSKRLGLTKHTDPVKIERDLMAILPREEWTNFSHWLIWHGRRRCDARRPECEPCELAHFCPSAGKVGIKKAKAKGKAPRGRKTGAKAVRGGKTTRVSKSDRGKRRVTTQGNTPARSQISAHNSRKAITGGA